MTEYVWPDVSDPIARIDILRTWLEQLEARVREQERKIKDLQGFNG